MDITIENQQKRIKVSPSTIVKITKKILLHEGVKEGFLSIVFVTDHKIKSLNKKYLKRDHATDVLAFDLADGHLPLSKKGKKSCLQAEIVISVNTAERNAKEYGTTFFREIILYIIHGILHLRGFDDHTEADVKRMRKKEHELLNVVQVHIK